MPNKHLEHPEDNLLNGVDPYEVLDSLVNFDRVSTKWDGAPAIVFGKDCNNDWFVGTKSVFNKVKVKINRSPAEIVANHGEGNVANILMACFYALPRDVMGIYQADFIGFGGDDTYQPNTIEYAFPKVQTADVIVAPHTKYDEISPDAVAQPIKEVLRPGSPIGTVSYRFLSNRATIDIPKRARFLLSVARLLVPYCKFPSVKTGKTLKVLINQRIRQGKYPSREMYRSLPDKYKQEVNYMTFRLYNIILKVKDILLSAATADEDVECFLKGEPTQHEGFVLHGKHSVKLVNRLEFSQANFNLSKNWTNEKV